LGFGEEIRDFWDEQRQQPGGKLKSRGGSFFVWDIFFESVDDPYFNKEKSEIPGCRRCDECGVSLN